MTSRLLRPLPFFVFAAVSFAQSLTAPSITKSFTLKQIDLNTETGTTFTILNSNSGVPLTGVGFTDSLPAGLSFDTSLSPTPSGCGSPIITLTTGSLTVFGATVTSQCSLIAFVQGKTTGIYTNTTSAVTSDNAGTGNKGSDTLTVIGPPSISKVFTPNQIPVGGGTALSVSIANPNTTVALTSVAFSDTFPTGITAATATAFGFSKPGCGSAPSINLTDTSLSASGISIPPSSTCTIQILGITGTTPGVYTNTTSAVTSSDGTGNTASAPITVVGPPSISKTFGALSIPLGETTQLSFTISNSNTTVALTGVGFTDTLPSGLLVANPNGLTGSCGGGTITALSGTNSIALTSATLAASASCTFSVNVRGISAGTQTNVTSTVSSIEGGTGNTATASIVVGDAFQLSYLANLNVADSFVNLTNAGSNGGFDPAGDICANVYVFAADQQLIACCTCPLTPNHLKTLSGQNDLVNNTLTPGVANAITVALIVTANPSGNAAACNASAVTASQLTVGLGAYGTKIHALPSGSYGVDETPFSPASLSASELMKLNEYCGFIQADGSKYGICGSCKEGAAGAQRQ